MAGRAWGEALTIQPHDLESKNPELAQTLIGLAHAKSVTQGPGAAVSL